MNDTTTAPEHGPLGAPPPSMSPLLEAHFGVTEADLQHLARDLGDHIKAIDPDSAADPIGTQARVWGQLALGMIRYADHYFPGVRSAVRAQLAVEDIAAEDAAAARAGLPMAPGAAQALASVRDVSSSGPSVSAGGRRLET